MRSLCSLLLVALALAITVFPGLARWFSGLRLLGVPDVAALDDPSRVQDSGTTRFFSERDQVEVTIHRDMTVGELLLLYQLHGHAHIRRQMADQLAVKELDDAVPLAGGTVFTLNLTPPEEAIP